MKALQTKNSHQPVWEAGIHKDKVSPRTEHACYLAYACCLVLPVVERGGAQCQVNRGVLERQCFRHACRECGVGSQAFCHLYHAVCRVYADQLRLWPIGSSPTQQFSCSTADIKDAYRLMDDTCSQGKRCLMCPIKKGSLQPGIFIGACPLIEALYIFFVMFCCHTCVSFPKYLRFASCSCCRRFSQLPSASIHLQVSKGNKTPYTSITPNHLTISTQ